MRPSTIDIRIHDRRTVPAPGAGRRLGRVLAPLVAVIALVVACDDGSDEQSMDAFAEDPDCFGIELVELEADQVRCGTVTAPLHHDDPDGESITLAVATLTVQDISDEPVLVLGGGPGQAVIETALSEPVVRQGYAAAGREVILLDQRGAGSSDPELACDDFADDGELDHDEIPSTRKQRDVLVACRDELVERGVDLDAFDHGNNARDVDLVRRALGHEQLVLRGTSYGSHLALHAAALAPDGFAALVLSSPADPSDNYLEAGPGGFQAALDRLDEACAQDQRCTDQLGGVHEAIDQLADRLADQPQQVTATPLSGGEPVTRIYTPEVLLAAVFSMFYLADGPFALPGSLIAAQQGDLQPLASYAATFEERAAELPRGMSMSMICSGEGATFDAEAAGAALSSATLTEYWFDVSGVGGRATTAVCWRWGVEPSFDPGQLELAPDIPTLLVTGEVDHVTPPVIGEQLHAQRSTSHLVEARGLGHAPLENLDVLADGCGSDIVTAFLDDPDREPDTTCTRQIPSLDAIGQYLP